MKTFTNKTAKLLVVLLVSTVSSNHAIGQLKVDNDGYVTLGTKITNTSSSGLIVYGNNTSNPLKKNFSVTFPSGNYSNARIEGLSAIGGHEIVWSSLFAYQGAFSYAAYFEGNTLTTGLNYTSSDINIKENFRPIDHPLERVLQLNGMVYDFKRDTIVYPDEILDFIESTRTNNLGFIAQEVRNVFPELVIENMATGYLALNYDGFSAVLVEAIKEQQRTIESLQKEIAELKGGTKGPLGIETQESHKSLLFQNIPNPTNSTTTIECYLDAHASKAMITVYDLNGLQLKDYPVNHQGKNIITVEANEFKPGIYLYSLLVDENLIDTKRMVITSKTTKP